MLWLPFVCAAATLCMGGCASGDDGTLPGGGSGNELPDPPGTVTVQMRYAEYITSGNEVKYVTYPVYIKESISLNANGNFTYEGHYSSGKFINVGPVRGLADVTSIPDVSSGWSDNSLAMPGYGYVSGWWSGSTDPYLCDPVRWYVVDYITDGLGNRIGVLAKYQYPFESEEQ